MPGKLDNPLVEQTQELAANVSRGWRDGQWAIKVLAQRARAMAADLDPTWRWEFLGDLAGQIEEAGRAVKDAEVFEGFARWLRAEVARDGA